MAVQRAPKTRSRREPVDTAEGSISPSLRSASELTISALKLRSKKSLAIQNRRKLQPFDCKRDCPRRCQETRNALNESNCDLSSNWLGVVADQSLHSSAFQHRFDLVHFGLCRCGRMAFAGGGLVERQRDSCWMMISSCDAREGFCVRSRNEGIEAHNPVRNWTSECS